MSRKSVGVLLFGLMLTGQMSAQTTTTTTTAATTTPTWVIAAAPFSITGRQRVTTKAETLIPTLMLDQLSGDHGHQVTAEESTKRKLALLQTRQQALFLELSAAIQKRDAAVLESPRTSKVKQKIRAEEKKIKDIKAAMDTNIHEIRLLRPAYASDLDVPLTGKTRRLLAKEQRDAKKEEDKGVVTEKVSLWKDDSAALYTAYRGSDGKAVDAGQLEKALATEKINALITGSISVQDAYIAVSVELRLYPGGELLGTAMEIGNITDMAGIARALAFDLMPGVESTRPAILVFTFDENMPKDFTLSVDSNTFSGSAMPDRYPVGAGVHQVSFEAPGYKTESLSMDFAPDTTYRLGVHLEKETLNAISLSLRNETKGFFLINGVTTANPAEGVSVGNDTLLGRFDPETAAEGTAKAPVTQNPGYFVVPPEAAGSPSRAWTVDPYLKDVSANIEKGRKSLYFSYTLLMISLPVLFVTLGEFTKYNNAVSNAIDFAAWQDARNKAQGWSIANYVAIGTTVTLGVNFLWRLIRYMKSADPVIPVTATPMRKVPWQSGLPQGVLQQSMSLQSVQFESVQPTSTPSQNEEKE